MKIRDVAKQYNLDPDLFESFINIEHVVPVSGFMANNIDDSDISKALAAFDLYLAAKNEKEAARKKKEDDFNNAIENITLSTCSSIDGYKAVKQLGLVFGECLFKASFLNQLSAGIEDFASALSFSETELSGTTELLDKARKYSTKKMVLDAVNRGANAIIGIDSESSAGGGIMHITICGTAVVLEPIED
jgi:uncharacterized protein YbjQ (UPF0145 family)